MQKRLVVFVITLAVSVAVGQWVHAHSGAKGVVKQRMELMKSLGTAMKQTHALVSGKTAYDPKKVAMLADQIRQHGENIAGLFPEGSRHGPTEASAKIWQDWDKFERSATKMVTAARALAAANGDAAAAGEAFKDVGASCKGCHSAFREKKSL